MVCEIITRMRTTIFPYRRIVVIGTSGFGKSTLGVLLAERLEVPFVELDALHWEPDWQPAKMEDFRARVDAATCSDGWVVAGNYSRVRDIVWPRAQVLIWLDYPFGVGLRRLVGRTLRRVITRQELWNGNRENLWPHLKLWSDESMIGWYFRSWGRRRRETPTLLAAHPHLHVLHFRTPAETEKYLEKMWPERQDPIVQ